MASGPVRFPPYTSAPLPRRRGRTGNVDRLVDELSLSPRTPPLRRVTAPLPCLSPRVAITSSEESFARATAHCVCAIVGRRLGRKQSWLHLPGTVRCQGTTRDLSEKSRRQRTIDTGHCQATIVSVFSRSRHLCDAIRSRTCRPDRTPRMAHRRPRAAFNRVSHHTPPVGSLPSARPGRSRHSPAKRRGSPCEWRRASPRARAAKRRAAPAPPPRCANRRSSSGYKNVRDAMDPTLM
jgi:hypothetical protein